MTGKLPLLSNQKNREEERKEIHKYNRNLARINNFEILFGKIGPKTILYDFFRKYKPQVFRRINFQFSVNYLYCRWIFRPLEAKIPKFS